MKMYSFLPPAFIIPTIVGEMPGAPGRAYFWSKSNKTSGISDFPEPLNENYRLGDGRYLKNTIRKLDKKYQCICALSKCTNTDI